MPGDPKFEATRLVAEFVRRDINRAEFRDAIAALGVASAKANAVAGQLLGGTSSQGQALVTLGFGG